MASLARHRSSSPRMLRFSAVSLSAAVCKKPCGILPIQREGPDQLWGGNTARRCCQQLARTHAIGPWWRLVVGSKHESKPPASKPRPKVRGHASRRANASSWVHEQNISEQGAACTRANHDEIAAYHAPSRRFLTGKLKDTLSDVYRRWAQNSMCARRMRAVGTTTPDLVAIFQPASSTQGSLGPR